MATECPVVDCARAALVVCGQCRRAVCAPHARPAWAESDGFLCIVCFVETLPRAASPRRRRTAADVDDDSEDE